MLPLITTGGFEEALDPYRAVRKGAGAALLAGVQPAVTASGPLVHQLQDGLDTATLGAAMTVVDQVEAGLPASALAVLRREPSAPAPCPASVSAETLAAAVVAALAKASAGDAASPDVSPPGVVCDGVEPPPRPRHLSFLPWRSPNP
jgi:hypothetical protein